MVQRWGGRAFSLGASVPGRGVRQAPPCSGAAPLLHASSAPADSLPALWPLPPWPCLPSPPLPLSQAFARTSIGQADTQILPWQLEAGAGCEVDGAERSQGCTWEGRCGEGCQAHRGLRSTGFWGQVGKRAEASETGTVGPWASWVPTWLRPELGKVAAGWTCTRLRMSERGDDVSLPQ